MIRYDVLQEILPLLKDRLVVCNIGSPSQELFELLDQPSNFYMLGTMGLCSSIGLGLALAQEKTVIAIDGDGSVLTNLATLSTIANNPASNFILLVIDNGKLRINRRSADLHWRQDISGGRGPGVRMRECCRSAGGRYGGRIEGSNCIQSHDHSGVEMRVRKSAGARHSLGSGGHHRPVHEAVPKQRGCLKRLPEPPPATFGFELAVTLARHPAG